jgi:glutamate-1-semialdehyde 2,1-aminomutase
LGHCHPDVVAAIRDAAGRGQSFGAPTLEEVELAERIIGALPAVEMVRLTSSGTEATMSALRLARATTGRDRVVKLAGCYHGAADPFLVAAGSGASTLGVPSSPGVPALVTAHTLLAPYNDVESVERLFAEHPAAIAAVIVEPIAGNMGLVPPVPGYLRGLRELCTRHGALLIFDEVMTGFRVGWSGAQGLLGIQPDLTCLAKVIGGGMPIGAYGGRRDLMQRVAPAGDVYQAGTLSGNPVAVAAGAKTLEILGEGRDTIYPSLDAVTERLARGIERHAGENGIPCQVAHCGSMLSFFLTDRPVRTLHDVDRSDRAAFSRLFHFLLERGVHLPPSPYETLFVSTAHGDEEIDLTLAAFAHGFRELSRCR